MTEQYSCRGALALELTPGSKATTIVLEQSVAGDLAALVARDLSKLVPIAAQLDLTLLGASFDPVELLRPSWPLHGELERLVTLAPGVAGSRVIAFAASQGQLPAHLQPNPDFAEGALRLLPLVLRGEASIARDVASRFEHSLLDFGMAGADTALLAQQAFGASIEHARYLTLHDLAAMMALQYENVGLGRVWPLIEAALLEPGHEQWLDTPPEPLVRLANGEARIALLDDQAWVDCGLAPADARHNQDRLDRAFDRFMIRQRQIAALLEAHGIPTTYDYCPPGMDPRQVLRD